MMDDIIRYYYQAKTTVYNHGFFPEVYWQERVCVDAVDTQFFLTEHAWVVLSSGMKTEVVKKVFKPISSSFNHWEDVDFILSNQHSIRANALAIFSHCGKVDALFSMAHYVSSNGLANILASLKMRGIEYLQQFPFLGPATSMHFAKNIGINTPKPDRHLVRISEKFGHTTDSLCSEIARLTGDKMSVIDIVLWRYATINKGYLSY